MEHEKMIEVQNAVYDDRIAIPTAELQRLLAVEADFKVIIRLINQHEVFEEKELGKLLMDLYKIKEGKDE